MPDFENDIKRIADRIGSVLVGTYHLIALFAIGAAIAWSATFAFWDMMQGRSATIEDILTLFIYLELGAMVGIYFKTMRMPVRFLIYVAITALTRMMIGRININHIPDVGIIYIASAILILAIAVLIVKYASSAFPSSGLPEEQLDADPDS